jgi:hypothetical protein
VRIVEGDDIAFRKETAVVGVEVVLLEFGHFIFFVPVRFIQFAQVEDGFLFFTEDVLCHLNFSGETFLRKKFPPNPFQKPFPVKGLDIVRLKLMVLIIARFSALVK